MVRGMSPVAHAVIHGCENEVFGRACRWKSVTTVKSLKETVGSVHVRMVMTQSRCGLSDCWYVNAGR